MRSKRQNMKDGKVLSMTDQGIIRMENLVDWCPEAFEFLKSKDLSNLDSGRYELGRGIYAEVSDSKNQSDSERKYESHRRYVDIHWIIKGTGIIEMHDACSLLVDDGYDAQKDLQFFHYVKGDEITISEGEGLILCPGTAHRSKEAVREDYTEYIKKIVFKVPIHYTKLIKCVCMDVDGTLTDGKIYVGMSGECVKAFNVKDGYAIKCILPFLGILPCIITGRESAITANRCKELGVNEFQQKVENKKKVLEIMLKKHHLGLGDVLYIGDDSNDMDCMDAVRMAGGITACPGDAAKEVLLTADYVSAKNGGNGAVRDVIDWLALSFDK